VIKGEHVKSDTQDAALIANIKALNNQIDAAKAQGNGKMTTEAANGIFESSKDFAAVADSVGKAAELKFVEAHKKAIDSKEKDNDKKLAKADLKDVVTDAKPGELKALQAKAALTQRITSSVLSPEDQSRLVALQQQQNIDTLKAEIDANGGVVDTGSSAYKNVLGDQHLNIENSFSAIVWQRPEIR